MLLGTNEFVVKADRRHVAAQKPRPKSANFEGEFVLASRDSMLPLVMGPMLGGWFVGDDPSVVYHITAFDVSSLTVKDAALTPFTTGLPALNTKRAIEMPLLSRLRRRADCLDCHIRKSRCEQYWATWPGCHPII